MKMRRNEMQCNSPSSPPDTPSLYWDSQPSTAELSGPTGVHSVFEDWEDDLANVANLSAAVIVEEDGAQTLLIPADSPYFAPPTPKKPFGSKFTIDADMEFERGGMYQVPSAPHTPPNTSNTAFQADPDLVSKGLILHINTSFSGHMSGNGVTLLSSVFFTPGGRVSDEASWAPTGFKQGPDVPLDCSYTAGTASPNVEYWDDEVSTYYAFRNFVLAMIYVT